MKIKKKFEFFRILRSLKFRCLFNSNFCVDYEFINIFSKFLHVRPQKAGLNHKNLKNHIKKNDKHFLNFIFLLKIFSSAFSKKKKIFLIKGTKLHILVKFNKKIINFTILRKFYINCYKKKLQKVCIYKNRPCIDNLSPIDLKFFS